MNIFILSTCPVEAAQLQCNKHTVKMPTESAQMLSTVHRLLDGYQTKAPSKSGKTLSKQWFLKDDRQHILYKSVHYSHPSTLWTMKSSENYLWHYRHFIALCEEYTYRYGKIHAAETRLRNVLCNLPKNIVTGSLTQFALAMEDYPECMFPDDPVKSYRMFYQTKQDRFKMVWSKREIPSWFVKRS